MSKRKEAELESKNNLPRRGSASLNGDATGTTPLLSANVDRIGVDSDYGTVAPPLSSFPSKVPSPPSIIWRLFLMFKWDIISAMALKCISDLLQFCNPLLLKRLIIFTEDATSPLWLGVFLSLCMFTASELSSLLLNHYYYLMYRIGTRVQTCLTATVYKKTLRLSNGATSR